MSILFTAAVLVVLAFVIISFPVLYQHVFVLLPGIAKYDPGDVLNRYLLLVIILFFWWIYHRLRLAGIGLGRPTRRRMQLLTWAMAAGSALILSFFLAKFLLGQANFDTSFFSRSNLARTLLWYLLGAATVALVEEILFRGITLEIFQQDARTDGMAIPLSALLFAAVHFIDFSYVADTMLGLEGESKFWSLDNLARFFLLTAVGVLLAYTRVRTNSLYAAIGLHAGFVVSLRICNKLFKSHTGESISLFQPQGLDIVLLGGILALSFVFAGLLPGDSTAGYARYVQGRSRYRNGRMRRQETRLD